MVRAYLDAWRSRGLRDQRWYSKRGGSLRRTVFPNGAPFEKVGRLFISALELFPEFGSKCRTVAEAGRIAAVERCVGGTRADLGRLNGCCIDVLGVDPFVLEGRRYAR